MGQISLNIPQIGLPDTTEDVKVANNFTTLQNTINGNIDSTNLSAATAQAAAVNQSGQTVKGATNIATSQSTTSTTYTTLATPDQVTGVVLPTNGLLLVTYDATWQESIAGAARAAIFIGANQLRQASQTGPVVSEAQIGGANNNTKLYTTGVLTSFNAAANYPGDATTGQVIGQGGLPAFIYAAAGTYTVSVQFKASSGTVTALNRKLWVQALSFA